MNLAICVTGVNDKNGNIVDLLRQRIKGANFYYHTWSNKTHLVPEEFHDRLYTMHYPKWHYHPMDVNPPSKHAKYLKHRNSNKIDEMYHGVAPILAYGDLLQKIPKHHDLIIRVDWNAQIDRQVPIENWMRYGFEKGPVGFITRDKRGPAFGSGRVEEADKLNHNDDWYGFLPYNFLIHHRDHFNITLMNKLLNEKKLYPNEWGWYQVLSEWHGDKHISMHGFVSILK